MRSHACLSCIAVVPPARPGIPHPQQAAHLCWHGSPPPALMWQAAPPPTYGRPHHLPYMAGHIEDRQSAALVYVLDVQERSWSRVVTSGSVPSWRSLHIAKAFRPPSGGPDSLIILGGSDKHIQPFSSDAPADFVPYVLDLEAYIWRRPQERSYASESTEATSADGDTRIQPFAPVARMRFAGEVFGARKAAPCRLPNMASLSGSRAFPFAHHRPQSSKILM